MSNLKSLKASAWLPALLAIGVVATPALCEAAARSQVDRTTIASNEALTLNIVSDSTQSGVQPDLSALRKDFAVLGSEQTSETNIINGTRSDRERWTVRLMPLQAGSVEIPAITVGNDRTAAISVTVTPPSAAARADAAGHAFLEIETAAAGRATFIQQSIPYTVRLFVDGSVQTGELSAPEASDAAVEQVGKDKRYTASRHGREYNVIERRYVISPEKSGTVTIAPVKFQGTAVLPPSDASDSPDATDDDPAADLMARMMRNSPFANDPMFRGGALARLGAAQATRPLNAQSQSLTLDVMPRPAGAQGSWLPAQAVTLHDSWQDEPPQFKVGEPVTRVITVEAKGIAGSQVPTLSLDVPSNARMYPESSDNQTQTDGQSVDGVSRQTLTYIPSAQGALVIAPLSLAWWDTQAGTQRSASLPAARFTVAPGAGGVTTASAPSRAADPSQASASTMTRPDLEGRVLQALQGLRTDGRWLAGGIAALGLVTIAALTLRRSRRPDKDASAPKALPTGTSAAVALPLRKTTWRAFREACTADDGHAAAKALLDLGRIEWPDDPPRGLGSLAGRVEAGAPEIIALDRSLYGNGNRTWKGDALWQALRNGLRTSSLARSSEASDLKPLYPGDRPGLPVH